MNDQLAVVLGLLSVAIVMFAINKPRMDAVALIMLTALPFTGVLSMSEALAGFSDSNIVLIAALFVIGDGLVRTGVAQSLGDWLLARAGSSSVMLLMLLMVVVAALGATMSSTAVTAIFVPVGLRIAQNTGAAPSKLMMPISFAALISGMMTLIATAPNLVVNSELVRHGLDGFHFFSFTPFGLVILVLGMVYMLFAQRWLPAGDGARSGQGGRPSLTEWIKEYDLSAREHRLRIGEGSSLVGLTVAEARLRDTSGASLVAIERAKKLLQPHANTELRVGDVLFVDLFAPNANVSAFRQEFTLEPLPITGGYFSDQLQEIGMAEVVVPASSTLVGDTLVGADFRHRYGLIVIGLKRGTESLSRGLENQQLHAGDTLLLTGPWSTIRDLQSNRRDFVVFNLPAEQDEVLPVSGRAGLAVACLLLVVGLMISGVVPNVQAALMGCLLMGALGCVDLNTAYRAIDWKTIVLIVGMLPFSLALDRTGGVELAADGLMYLVGDAGIYLVLGTLFALTAVLGMFISNTATAVLMAPVAIALAKDLGFSPYPFAMIVALAASSAFMTPVSSPVNTLVVGPGNYTFGDFVKIGVPFTLIVLVTSIFLVPVLLPLSP
ncbi:Citrate transporter [Pirellulimonas nuda]|uniref:Citrate transporter n=1 Tax=Pirellulimonas nuda TaxID=2528009 RepID=A0A518DG04_9BACT|nr:SLC13 family permease [Pirellulimonas nuda]QDU90362.1 Citrate transporter [Pirellulimonas nuda]